MIFIVILLGFDGCSSRCLPISFTCFDFRLTMTLVIIVPYKTSFLTSDWKMFHDALLVHRLVVIRDILPRYGICCA